MLASVQRSRATRGSGSPSRPPPLAPCSRVGLLQKAARDGAIDLRAAREHEQPLARRRALAREPVERRRRARCARPRRRDALVSGAVRVGRREGERRRRGRRHSAATTAARGGRRALRWHRRGAGARGGPRGVELELRLHVRLPLLLPELRRREREGGRRRAGDGYKDRGCVGRRRRRRLLGAVGAHRLALRAR